MNKYLLWLLVLLVLLQAYNTLETIPEFHLLSHDDYVKEIQANSNLTDLPQGIGRLEVNEYFNGRYGMSLAKGVLIIDVAMFLLLVILIGKSSRSQKEVTTGNK